MNTLAIRLIVALLAVGLVTSQNGTPKPPATMDSIDNKIDDMEKRLYSIEDKIDHLLFHHSHDVTPHNIQFSPMGPVMMPEITNPRSAHTQMKTHDILRNGIVNPYNMGFGGPYAMGGYGGYPGVF